MLYKGGPVDYSGMTAEEREMHSRASVAVNEYRLIQAGVTFDGLGYGAPAPMVKLMEYLAIDTDVKMAAEDATKHG